MLLEGAVAEHIERQPLLVPASQLLRPLLKQRLIDLHARMADVAHKGKIGGAGNLQREIRLTLPRLKQLLLLRRTCSDGACIHHHPCHAVLAKQVIQRLAVLRSIKIGMTDLDRQTNISGLEVEKCLKLGQLGRAESWRKLQE